MRTRRYVDSDLTMLEVKEKGGRGETVKHRTDWSPTELFRLGSGGRDIAVSKYCAGIALTHGAPANRWHRVLNRYLRPVA